MKKSFALVSIAILLTGLFSCNNKKNGADSGNSVDTVAIQNMEIKELYYMSGDTANPSCKVALSLDIPVHYKQDNDYLRLQKLLTPLAFGDEYMGDSLAQAAYKVVSSHIDAFKDLEREYKQETKESGEAYSYEWAFDYTLSPVFNRNGFISYLIATQEYTGGAHGMYSDRYYTFDLTHWKRIVLDDIFPPEDTSIESVNKLLLNKLLKNLNLTNPEGLLDLGYFDTTDITATENFYLTRNGICWVYNPYDIACYATGKTQIELSYSELAPYILLDSPIRTLIP